MSNVYRIALSLVAHNNAGGALMALSSQLLHVHGLVNQTNAALGRMRLAMGGAAAIFVGAKMVEGYADLVEHGAKFVGIQNQMTAQGWKQAEIAEAVRKSWELTAKYQSVGAAEILEMQKEMAPVLGSREDARGLAETMTKLNVAMLGTLGIEGNAQNNRQIIAAIKSGELSGNILQPAQFEKYLDGMAKTIKAFGGTVMPSDYYMATKYGRASAMNWSDDFTNNILPSVIQELGASSTGTALMSMYQGIVAGKMTQASINQWDDIGMIDHSKLDPKDLTPEGRAKRLEPGAFTGSRDFMENPFKWMWEDVVPHMQAAGKLTQSDIDHIQAGDMKDGEGKVARQKVTEFLALLFGNRTAQGMADVLLTQYKKLMRESKLRDDAMGLDDGAVFYGQNDYKLAKESFHQQWEDLLTALGAPEVNNAVKMLHAVTDGLTYFGQAAAAHPAITSDIVGAGLVGGVGLITAGIIALGLAVVGPGAMIGVVLTGIATGVGALAALHKDDIANWWNGTPEHMDKNGGMHAKTPGFLEAMTKVPGAVWEGVKRAWTTGTQQLGQFMSNAIASIPGMVMGAISSMASAIGSALSSAIAGIASGFSASPGVYGRGGGAVGGGTGGIQKQSWVPPGGGAHATQINNTINMDGRAVARGVTYHQARAAAHVQSAANFDPILSPTPVDLAHA